ncbi:DDE superfamily endonuclease containing protein [Histomonas meleagridis]|uniref:DDE superfamily endonuclease containing protein n=1 Tax=Histomonas meleagridis TaxID=135588 RepID=UPI0035594E0B|nr:DDE superfamily endonuclease containing protein [Histomonas meleagridis]
MSINNNWRPWLNNHGIGHRIFTDDEEAAIKDYIFKIDYNFISQGFYFNDEDFADIAYQSYLEKNNQNEKMFEKEFLISKCFIHNFKKRNHISSRKPHLKRRPVTPEDDKNKFIEKIRNLLETTDRSRIVNADETSWKSFPGEILTWSEKGSDNVKVFFEGNPKQSVTVLAGIKADGTKLPLFIIAKGTTERTERNLGDISYHISGRSKSGWTTEGTFQDYLTFLRKHFGDNDKIHLIIDHYKSHETEKIKDLANRLNIDLIFIPAGLTDCLQPLDRLVFGCLKSTARRLYKKTYQENPNTVFNKEMAIKHLLDTHTHSAIEASRDTLASSRAT